MRFEDIIEFLKLEIGTVKDREGYIVVSMQGKDGKDIYDSSTIDQLFTNLTMNNEKPEYVCVYSLYIKNNVPLRFSIEFKKEGNEYRCDMKKDI